ncbi:MAG: hypothetical protein AAFR46_12620 [Pseudomonadota bacterium]
MSGRGRKPAKRRSVCGLAACLLAGGLAACAPGAGGPAVFDVGKNQQYFTKGTVSIGGRAPVVLLGNVPGADAAAFIATLRSPGYQAPVRFELATGPAAAVAQSAGFRFVFAFGASDNTRLCTAPSAGGGSGVIAAALCNGGDTVTRATLRLGGARVEDGLPSLMRTLMPRPTRTNNDSPN